MASVIEGSASLVKGVTVGTANVAMKTTMGTTNAALKTTKAAVKGTTDVVGGTVGVGADVVGGSAGLVKRGGRKKKDPMLASQQRGSKDGSSRSPQKKDKKKKAKEKNPAYTGCALSRDGRSALGCADDGTLGLWELDTGMEVMKLEGHAAAVTDCALSGNGRWALSCSEDKTCRVWELTTGSEVMCLEGHTAAVTGCALSADGRLALSSSSDKTCRVWNLNTGAEVMCLEGHTAAVTGCAFSRGGKKALTCSEDMTCRLWALETGREIVAARVAAPEVQPVAAKVDLDKWIKRAAAEYHEKIATTHTDYKEHTDQAARDRFNSDKALKKKTDFIMTAKQKEVRQEAEEKIAQVMEFEKAQAVEDRDTGLATAETTHEARGIEGQSIHDAYLHHSAVRKHAAKMWLDDHVGDAEELCQEQIAAAKEKHDERILAAEARLEQTLAEIEDKEEEVQASPTKASLKGIQTVAQGTLDKATGMQTLAAKAEREREKAESLRSDARHEYEIETAMAEKAQKDANAASEKRCKEKVSEYRKQHATFLSPTGGFKCCALSRSGKRAVTGSSDKTIRVWELETGKEVLKMEGHTGAVSGVALSHDGKIALSCSYDKTCRVWDCETGVQVRCLEGHLDAVTACGFSEGAVGTRILTSSMGQSCRVWEISSGQEVFKLTGGNSAFRRRVAASSLMKELMRPHRFYEGDDVSDLVCGGGDKSKMIKLGLTLGMTVPVPGFAVVGGLAGAALASPQVQLVLVRGIHNRAIQQLSVISPPGSEDIELMIDLATKGTAFVQAAVHSLEAGDWTLSGEDDGEKLQLWHKKDLSSGRVGLVEDAYKMEAFVEEGIPPPLAAFDQRHTVELDDGENGSPEAPPAPRRRLQVVHTQKIMAGSVKLSETRRVYRFQLDDAVETRDLLAEAKEKVAEANKMAEAKDKDYKGAIADLMKARNLVHEDHELKEEVNTYLQEVQTLREIAEAEALAAAIRAEAQRLFAQIDLNGDGTLNVDELKALARQLGVELSQRAAESVFVDLDTDGNGEIDFEEFFVFFLANRDKGSGGLKAGFTNFFGDVAFKFKKAAEAQAAKKALENVDPTAVLSDDESGAGKKKKKKKLSKNSSKGAFSSDSAAEGVFSSDSEDESGAGKKKKKKKLSKSSSKGVFSSDSAAEGVLSSDSEGRPELRMSSILSSAPDAPKPDSARVSFSHVSFSTTVNAGEASPKSGDLSPRSILAGRDAQAALEGVDPTAVVSDEDEAGKGKQKKQKKNKKK